MLTLLLISHGCKLIAAETVRSASQAQREEIPQLSFVFRQMEFLNIICFVFKITASLAEILINVYMDQMTGRSQAGAHREFAH